MKFTSCIIAVTLNHIAQKASLCLNLFLLLFKMLFLYTSYRKPKRVSFNPVKCTQDKDILWCKRKEKVQQNTCEIIFFKRFTVRVAGVSNTLSFCNFKPNFGREVYTTRNCINIPDLHILATAYFASYKWSYFLRNFNLILVYIDHVGEDFETCCRSNA